MTQLRQQVIKVHLRLDCQSDQSGDESYVETEIARDRSECRSDRDNGNWVRWHLRD